MRALLELVELVAVVIAINLVTATMIWFAIETFTRGVTP